MTGSKDSLSDITYIWGQALKIKTEELRAIAGLILKHFIHFDNTWLGGKFVILFVVCRFFKHFHNHPQCQTVWILIIYMWFWWYIDFISVVLILVILEA